MKRRLTLLLLGLCTAHLLAAQSVRTLKIAAAADLQPLLPAVMAEFHRQTGIEVEASYAASATLTNEIVNGGPFDLFLAADMSFPGRVIAAGLADSAKPVPYARGTLVLWTRNDSPIHILTLDSLKDASVRNVAVANAEHAPYGRAAMAALNNLGLLNALRSKLVIAENIAQTAQYVDSGNAELGLISLTSALTPRLRSAGRYIPLPENSYPPILQGAVVLRHASNREDAHRFLNFLLSPPIREQLARRGLRAP